MVFHPPKYTPWEFLINSFLYPMINLKIETKITLVHEESATDIVYLIAKQKYSIFG